MTQSSSADRWHDLDRLLDRVLDGLYVEEDAIQLNNMLISCEGAVEHYISYITLHGRLVWERGAVAERTVWQEIFADQKLRHAFIGQDLSCNKEVGMAQQRGDQSPSYPVQPFLPASNISSNSFNVLSSGWPVAYLIATVVLAIGALIGTFTYVSQPEPLADQRNIINPQSPIPNAPCVVGQITAMADCTWAGTEKSPSTKAVALDRPMPWLLG